ncbi:hypothetical protein, partial [Salmonella enterica]|uniref:hypothetical protein n=1 Tax=Salmonella enterica TaxID=28901 RepID=UPI003299606A
MFITMVGDVTAFSGLVFGYFFYWTVHENFTGAAPGPGQLWPLLGLAGLTVAWAFTLFAARRNATGSAGALRIGLA